MNHTLNHTLNHAPPDFTEAANAESQELMMDDEDPDSSHHQEPPQTHDPVHSPIRIAWERFRDLAYKLESSKLFQNFTIFVIVLNTINLGIVW